MNTEYQQQRNQIVTLDEVVIHESADHRYRVLFRTLDCGSSGYRVGISRAWWCPAEQRFVPTRTGHCFIDPQAVGPLIFAATQVRDRRFPYSNIGPFDPSISQGIFKSSSSSNANACAATVAEPQQGLRPAGNGVAGADELERAAANQPSTKPKYFSPNKSIFGKRKLFGSSGVCAGQDEVKPKGPLEADELFADWSDEQPGAKRARKAEKSAEKPRKRSSKHKRSSSTDSSGSSSDDDEDRKRGRK